MPAANMVASDGFIVRVLGTRAARVAKRRREWSGCPRPGRLSSGRFGYGKAVGASLQHARRADEGVEARGGRGDELAGHVDRARLARLPVVRGVPLRFAASRTRRS